MESVLGFHMLNVKLRRIFLPFEAEKVIFPPEFSINTFYKTDQAHLLSQEMSFCIIISGILLTPPPLTEWKDQDT